MENSARPLDPTPAQDEFRAPHLEIVQSEVVRASFLSRFVAMTIDGFILAAFGALLSAVFVAIKGGKFNASLIVNLFGLFYFVILQYNDGQTLGKKLMKIKVVPSDDRPELSLGQVFGREFIGRIVMVFTFLIGYLMVIFRKDRRGLHDLMFKTQVIVKK